MNLASIASRVDSRRDMSGGPDACWPRTTPVKRICLSKVQAVEIRRAAWLVETGTLPANDIMVRITCGLKECLNPRHMLVRTYEEHFWTRVDVRGPDDCWNWTGPTKRGYGHAAVNRHRQVPGRTRIKSVRANRVAYELHHGVELDPKQLVCHSCDNPSCCNPAHLWLGTNADNIHDMLAKGRAKWQRDRSLFAGAAQTQKDGGS